MKVSILVAASLIVTAICFNCGGVSGADSELLPIFAPRYSRHGISPLINKNGVRKSPAANKMGKKTVSGRMGRTCPVDCACQGLSIDCSYRSISAVPVNIPKSLIKV